MMKALLVICMLVAAPFLWAADKPATPSPAAANVVSGEVLEAQDAGGYTYLRLKTAQGETWAAVATSPVKKGAKVTIENATFMTNFQSKALKKTFDKIVFGNLAGAGGAPKAGSEVAGAHAGVGKGADTADVRVPKASGANARTVAEIMTKPTDLKDKPVLVRGKVVKYSGGIMGKNWIHLRDGTGSAADKTNDVLVTTSEQAKVSDVITAKGVVRVDKDFGAGYTYKAMVEDATLQK
jgi:hypothetical protein